MPVQIVFFDVDHTLIRHSTGYHFALEARKYGVFKIRNFVSLLLTYLAYRFGRKDLGSIQNGFPALKGFSQFLLNDIAISAFNKRIRYDFFPDALVLVSRLKAEGKKIILATAGLDFIVKPIAEYLGVDSYIGSSLEFSGNISTGCFNGGLLFGDVKCSAAQKAAIQYGLKLDECSFYSDSIYDLPLLLKVHKPVAVNPDIQLKREAKHKEWEIIFFR